MYVLQRNEDGAYVARPGSARSYTRKLAAARIFKTRQAAEADACGNETARLVSSSLGN